MRICLLSIILVFAKSYILCQKPAFLTEGNTIWVDSVFQTLDLDRKVGQLLMPRANYSGKPHDLTKLEGWIRNFHIGGLVMFASQPTTQAVVTNKLQSLSKLPLFIGQDLEWGLAMRLDSADRFPYAMTLGAVQGDLEQFQAMGEEIGRQCNRMGVHINYAPVVDVNVNPENPVINFRSFSGDKLNVTAKATNIMLGLQKQRVICTAKHFPGHGDTDVDSHKALPIINHDINRLHDIELYPFKALINANLAGVMIAHLDVPALENKSGLASTFSRSIVTDLLKKDMNFQGLTFTDAMDMEGAIKNFPSGEAFVQAVLAGNDIIETFMDVPTAFESIKRAVQNGRIPISLLDEKVKRILLAKSWTGLDKYAPIRLDSLITDINTLKAKIINYTLTKASITCLKNEHNYIPIRDLSQKIAVVCIDGDPDNKFVKMVRNYMYPDVFYVSRDKGSLWVDTLKERLKTYDFAIVSIHFKDIRPYRNYGLNPQNTESIRKLISLPNAIVCMMASPFIMKDIQEFENCHTILTSYQLSDFAEEAMPQAIFGAQDIQGKLPMSVNNVFKMNMGVQVKSMGRLTYGPSDVLGINSKLLARSLDSIVHIGLQSKAYPGCVLQVTYNGQVIHQKAYGYHTYLNGKEVNSIYDSGQKVVDDAMDNFDPSNMEIDDFRRDLYESKKTDIHDLYDLASVTKIAASALALMRLSTANKLDVNKRLLDYLPSTSDSPMGNLKMKDMLTHRSGLKPWIPFWRHAIDTSLTWKGAIDEGLWPKDSINYILQKPSWIRKLFGVKSKIAIDVARSISVHPLLWDKVLASSFCKWKTNTIRVGGSENYSIHLGNNLFAHKDFPAYIQKMILLNPLNDTTSHKYIYSDLHFYFYPELVNSLVHKPFNDYVYETYKKLGAYSLSFNPDMNRNRVVPTEVDTIFRKHLIHGKVHDEGAILMGGISGHAGLFGNANDLTKLLYMYLRKGSYAGESFIHPDIVNQFTSYAFPDEKNRRGLAFDKKDFDASIHNAPKLSSTRSFGHSGFTGTYAWVDPDYDLVYVFLSNRVYPTRANQKINDLKIRQNIGDVVIKAIENKGRDQ